MKQTLISVIIIGLVALTAGAGTYALFSDTGASTGNTFMAGTLDLEIRDGADWADNIGAEWSMPSLLYPLPMKPGDDVSGTVSFRNVGSVAATDMEISCSYTIVDPAGPTSDTQESTPADHMADYMIITEMTYYHDGVPTNCLSLLTDNDADGIDLLELQEQGVVGLAPPDGNGDEHLTMIIKFDENAGNDFQGDTLYLTMIFTMNQ